jgi:hypothetical protein
VAPVAILRVPAIDLLHDLGKIALRCLKEKMIVIRHQTVAVANKSGGLLGSAEHF